MARRIMRSRPGGIHGGPDLVDFGSCHHIAPRMPRWARPLYFDGGVLVSHVGEDVPLSTLAGRRKCQSP